MGCGLLAAFCFLFVIAGNKKSFVETTPLAVSNGHKEFKDETVKELERLKDVFRTAVNDKIENGDEISVSKSQISIYRNLNGSEFTSRKISNEVDKNGKVLAKISQKVDATKNDSASKTEIDIPSEGIHRVIKDDANMQKKEEKKDGSVKSGNKINKIKDFSEIKYRPLDVAEYIFWTGDEKGVALTIKEFLEQGLMSRQEAIDFLQSIKFNLDFMQSHYQGLAKMDKVPNEESLGQKVKSLNEETLIEKRKENFYDEISKGPKLTAVDFANEKSASSEIAPDIKPASYAEKLNAANSDSKGEEFSPQSNKIYPKSSTVAKATDGLSVTDDDYDEVVEKLRKTDALQEVIFELAKIMFSESLIKGNAGAQKGMQRFSSFLQSEVKRGQISAALEKKILDILLTALMDALSDHPELINRSLEELQLILEQNSATSRILRQLLFLGAKGALNESNLKSRLLENVLLSGKKNLLNGLK